MLAAVMPPHNDFHTLARYLLLGKNGKGSPERVAWVFAQNLPTDDPMLAATYMQATAERSRRCKNAAYHTIISWHEAERPSAKVMQEIARRTLDLAGLAGHQALVMGHGDTAHRHLHMMINRVSPVTGRAWSTSHDFKRFDRIMRELAGEYGFQYVPAHSFDPHLTDDQPKKPNKRATYAAKRGASTDRLQWSRRAARTLAGQLSEHLDPASSFDDIVDALQTYGLEVEPKGKGFVAGNRSSYVKLSALGLSPGSMNTSKKRVGRRRPGSPWRPTRSTFSLDEVDIARAIGSRDELRAAIDRAKVKRHARVLRLPLMAQLLADLRERLKAFTAHTPPKPAKNWRHQPQQRRSKELPRR